MKKDIKVGDVIKILNYPIDINIPNQTIIKVENGFFWSELFKGADISIFDFDIVSISQNNQTVVEIMISILKERPELLDSENFKKDCNNLFIIQIKEAYRAGEENIDFPALHGQGKLSDCDKYYQEKFVYSNQAE